MKLFLENKVISGIPVLEIYQENISEKRPLIFLIHGLTGKKEHMFEYGLEFAKEGFYSCLFDAHMHGELKPDTIKNPDDYFNLKPDQFFKIHDQTAQNINILLESYVDSKLTDWNQVGLMGVSMGGLVIFKYLTYYYRENIKAAVPILGSPAWYNMITNYMLTMNKPNLFSHEDLKYIKSIEPFNVIKNIKNVSLLVLNGEIDSTIPIKDVRICYDVLKENYLNEDRLKLVEYPGVGHQVTDEMINETKNWFKNFLS